MHHKAGSLRSQIERRAAPIRHSKARQICASHYSYTGRNVHATTEYPARRLYIPGRILLRPSGRLSCGGSVLFSQRQVSNVWCLAALVVEHLGDFTDGHRLAFVSERESAQHWVVGVFFDTDGRRGLDDGDDTHTFLGELSGLSRLSAGLLVKVVGEGLEDDTFSSSTIVCLSKLTVMVTSSARVCKCKIHE